MSINSSLLPSVSPTASPSEDFGCEINGNEGNFKLRNLIGTLTLPNITENVLEIEVIHDIDVLEDAKLKNIELGYFLLDSSFGEIDFDSIESKIELSNSTEVVNFQVDHSTVNNLESDDKVATATFCLEDSVGNITVSFITTFLVNNSICNIDGENAIPSSWLAIIESNFNFIEVGYV